MKVFKEPYEWKSFNQMFKEYNGKMLLVTDVMFGDDDDVCGGYLVAEADNHFDDEIFDLVDQYEGKNIHLLEMVGMIN